MLQRELLHKNHHSCLRSTYSVNSTGSQFNGASSSSSPLLPSRRCTLALHYLSNILIPYCPSRVLGSSSSSHLLQVPGNNLIFDSRSFRTAGTLFPTHSVHLVHSILSGVTFTKQLLIPFSGILQRLRFTCVINGLQMV